MARPPESPASRLRQPAKATGRPGRDAGSGRTRRPTQWQQAAETLAVLIPRERLHPAVRAWAARRTGRDAWGVAFSGGPDSLALLLLLWAHWPGRRKRMVALHFDHRLRGAASRQDAAFCRSVCAGLGVKCVSGEWKGVGRKAPPATGRADGGKANRTGPSEAEARAARLAFFERQASARILWLGHQQDDIAETMLMRLARGSGAGGLAAPRPVQPMPNRRVHLRPLLTLKKGEIVAALRRAGIEWREDATNARGHYFRNRIRHDVVPAWNKAAERDALAGAARARELLEEDDDALAAWLKELAPLGARGDLALDFLSGKPRALVRRALYQWLAAHPRAGELSRQAFDALLDAVQRGKPTRHSVGRDGFAVIRGLVLRFERAGKR